MEHIPESFNHSFDLIFLESLEARLSPVFSNDMPPHKRQPPPQYLLLSSAAQQWMPSNQLKLRMKLEVQKEDEDS